MSCLMVAIWPVWITKGRSIYLLRCTVFLKSAQNVLINTGVFRGVYFTSLQRYFRLTVWYYWTAWNHSGGTGASIPDTTTSCTYMIEKICPFDLEDDVSSPSTYRTFIIENMKLYFELFAIEKKPRWKHIYALTLQIKENYIIRTWSCVQEETIDALLFK